MKSSDSDDVLQLGHHGHHFDSVMRGQRDQIAEQMEQLTTLDDQRLEAVEGRRLKRKIFDCDGLRHIRRQI